MNKSVLNKILFALLFIFFLHCVNPFAPGLVDKIISSNELLTEQKSPDDVLINFKYAYKFQDSLIYSDVIDSSFTFHTMDYDISPPTPIEWNRDEELRITGRMLRYFSSIDLIWNNTIYTDTLSDNEIEMRKSFILIFNEGSQIPILSGQVQFKFTKRNDEKWYLSYWEDLKL